MATSENLFYTLNRVNDSDVVYARVIVRPLFDDVIIREQSINGDIVGSRPTGGGFDPLCSHLGSIYWKPVLILVDDQINNGKKIASVKVDTSSRFHLPASHLLGFMSS